MQGMKSGRLAPIGCRRRMNMPFTNRLSRLRISAIAFALSACAALIWGLAPIATRAGQSAAAAVGIDSDDIGGEGSSSKGPGAGVWGIAGTMDLPTRLAQNVVNHDTGPYIIPLRSQTN